MNATKHFASFLYFAVLLGLIVSSLYFVVAISAAFFGTDGQYNIKTGNSTWTIGKKSSEGYIVPISLTVQIPDSIYIKKSHNGIYAQDSYPSIDNKFLKENKKVKAVNIYNVHQMKNYVSIGADENGNYLNPQKSRFTFIKYPHQSGNSPYIKVKTKDNFTNVILYLREAFSFIFFILQMLFLALILRELAKEIYFSKTLSKYILRLGYAILLSQLIPIIYCFIDLKLFGLITIEPQILASLQNTYFENMSVSFNPTMDTNLYIILLGAILVLLTKLIERGRALEEENELTI